MKGLSHLCVFTAFLAAVLVGPISIAASAPPVEGKPVLVVGPRTIVLAAAGYEISPQVAPFAVIAQSDRSGFAERLKDTGAWLVLDAAAFAQFCGVNIDDFL